MKHKGLLFAIVSPLVTSIATILLGGSVKLLDPWIILSFSPLIASVTLFLIVLLRGQRFKLQEIKDHQGDIFSLIVLRQIIGWAIFVVGLTFTDVIKAIFFTKVEPYFVLLIHWFVYKEKVQKKHLLLLAVHIFGAILLSTGGKNIGFGKAQFGDLLVILSMACSSLSYIPATKLAKAIGAIKINTISQFAAALVFLPFAFLFSAKTGWVDVRGWVYLVGYTILFSCIGLTLWFASLKTVKSWIVSSLRALGPLIGVPFAYLLLGETLTAVQLVGGVIILATSFLIAREHITLARKK